VCLMAATRAHTASAISGLSSAICNGRSNRSTDAGNKVGSRPCISNMGENREEPCLAEL